MKTFHRAVITGLGAVTPIGVTTGDYWQALMQGVSGAAPITRFDPMGFKTRFACEVKGFNPELYLEPKEIRAMDLYCQFAIAAATQAVDNAGFVNNLTDRFRGGVIFASGIGGLYTMQEEILRYGQNPGRPRFSPHFIPKMIPNIAAGVIGVRYDLRGINYATVSACASSSHAIADALNHIRLGKADVLVVGGAEAPINATALGGFSSMRALSEHNEEPQIASRPFDKDRDGFVLGEGAAALVIESLDHALARGATIYAELAGAGMTADAYHLTLPHPEGRSVYQAMKVAIEDADVEPGQIDYINLHGTSTPAGDPPELMAVQQLFSATANRLHVSSTKSMTGHLLGAAGAIEAVATVLAIHNSMIPPTINTKNIDPAIAVRVDLTLGKPVSKEIGVAMSNTFGFGGQNAVIVLKQFTK
ncbi:MAG: beta-ketoacyl-ACP synthase II [Chitinivibrionales bacterium]|nr:beta-ketoacyl-ACP synthase II [Chitinivibrionales bacterium]